MPAQRSPEEIRASIEQNRTDLAHSLDRLRGEVTELTDWRKQIQRHQKQVLIGAAVAGFVIGGGRRGLRHRRGHRRHARPLPPPALARPEASAAVHSLGGPMEARSLSTATIAKVFFTVVALSALVYVLYLVRSVLILIFIAGFLAVALGPAVDFFQRRKVPRSLSILLVYLCILLGIVGVGLLVVPPIVDQVDGLSQDIP